MDVEEFVILSIQPALDTFWEILRSGVRATVHALGRLGVVAAAQPVVSVCLCCSIGPSLHSRNPSETAWPASTDTHLGKV